jgi:hypothetical protein
MYGVNYPTKPSRIFLSNAFEFQKARERANRTRDNFRMIRESHKWFLDQNFAGRFCTDGHCKTIFMVEISFDGLQWGATPRTFHTKEEADKEADRLSRTYLAECRVMARNIEEEERKDEPLATQPSLSMNVYQARNELRRMRRKHLLRLASAQRISKCLIGGRACGLYLPYRGFNFCVSEIMGQGCQVHDLANFEEPCQVEKETDWSLPLLDRIGIGPLPPGKKSAEFKVYCRDRITRSITFLGGVIERRAKERENNLRALLAKAVKDYSHCVADLSTIFILSP